MPAGNGSKPARRRPEHKRRTPFVIQHDVYRRSLSKKMSFIPHAKNLRTLWEIHTKFSDKQNIEQESKAFFTEHPQLLEQSVRIAGQLAERDKNEYGAAMARVMLEEIQKRGAPSLLKQLGDREMVVLSENALKHERDLVYASWKEQIPQQVRQYFELRKFPTRTTEFQTFSDRWTNHVLQKGFDEQGIHLQLRLAEHEFWKTRKANKTIRFQTNQTVNALIKKVYEGRHGQLNELQRRRLYETVRNELGNYTKEKEAILLRHVKLTRHHGVERVNVDLANEKYRGLNAELAALEDHFVQVIEKKLLFLNPPATPPAVAPVPTPHKLVKGPRREKEVAPKPPAPKPVSKPVVPAKPPIQLVLDELKRNERTRSSGITLERALQQKLVPAEQLVTMHNHGSRTIEVMTHVLEDKDFMRKFGREGVQAVAHALTHHKTGGEPIEVFRNRIGTKKQTSKDSRAIYGYLRSHGLIDDSHGGNTIVRLRNGH